MLAEVWSSRHREFCGEKVRNRVLYFKFAGYGPDPRD